MNVSPELIERYDRPGPRYTSYPTAVEFDASFPEAEYRAHLARASLPTQEPLSLYVHLPFCRKRCSFCGCNVVITDKQDVVEKYLGYLHREIEMLSAQLGDRRIVTQYHWGGGTPTYLSEAQMQALHAKVAEHFSIDPQGELSVEADPRVTTRGQLEMLRSLGFNRLSLGVQDFDAEVQAAINRTQDVDATKALFFYARERGFESINVDLVYGLPMQTRGGFTKTLEHLTQMRPDRVALYSYAYVPWLKGNQKRIEVSQLPQPRAKLGLFCLARNALVDAGYRSIGMDHFALPNDEMARASEDGTLHRNFMGYTVENGTDMVGVGVSAIGDVRGAFVQNEKKLSRYYSALDEGRFPIERGYRLDADDEVRRAVIAELMCNFRIPIPAIERRFDLEFAAYFADELDNLRAPGGPVEDGFVELHPERIDVVGNGRLFVRNVAMLFDAHLDARQAGRPRFSQTV
jgi:oxygen-independent coproporphyrinogen-3 oxidase